MFVKLVMNAHLDLLIKESVSLELINQAKVNPLVSFVLLAIIAMALPHLLRLCASLVTIVQLEPNS